MKNLKDLNLLDRFLFAEAMEDEKEQRTSPAYRFAKLDLWTKDMDDAIYDTAVNDLGMIYPGKGQVITYDSKESEYVKQFKDVPEAGK